MQTKPTGVAKYLEELPPDRRADLSAVRDVILKNLDAEFEEGIQYGMIGYFVPHRIFPAGYHCDPRQPLPFAVLGSKKNYMSLHLMSLYVGIDRSPQREYALWFQKAWLATGKKLDMGKACIRFKKLEDVPLEVIGEAFHRMTARKWIEICTAATGKGKAKSGARKPKRASK